MKQLQKSDLKEGEIYKAVNKKFNYVFKFTKDLKDVINITSYNMFFKDGNFTDNFLQFYEATPEEKHWLNTCIEADKFVSYKEAMKTFIPEYVECISITYPSETLTHFGEINKIYKVLNYNHSLSDMVIEGYSLSVGKERFKPSTKEAYDAQFVVKEPEIILEEPKDKVLEKEGIDLNIGKIIRVKSSEGAIFELGDKVTVFNKDSPNKGKVFTIKGFRWNNAKTNICAITELHKLNGIGVDKLEIYIESKVKENLTLPKKECIQIPLIKEESLLDKAKRLYPIGTKFKNAYRGKFDKDVIFEIDGNNIYNPQFKKIGIHYGNNWLVFNDQWAEVIEYPHGFKVGDKISHKDYSTNWEIEKIEGNVLFLKDQPLFYNTILAKNAIKVDDFVLPEKWCVKNTDPLIYRFFDSKLKYMSQCYNNPIHENNYLHSIDLGGNNVINSQIGANIAYNYVKPDYTEITFEQFKKYVLNETV